MPDTTTKDICGGEVLKLTELKTCEGFDDEQALATLVRADEHAADLIIGGIRLPADAGPVRLTEAIEAVSGIARCDCKNREDANSDAMQREPAA